MKRVIISLALVAAAVASYVWAQATAQATLQAPGGQRPIAIVEQSGQTYFAADEMLAAFGGSITRDSRGFRVVLNNVPAAFGADSRFGVVRDDLIEMPVPPIVVEGRAFVPWQFFQGLFNRALNLDVTWDGNARLLMVRPAQKETISAQVSVVNVEQITKVVIQLSSRVDYAIAHGPGTYTITFQSPVRAPFPEQTYDDPLVSKLVFGANDVTIHLTSPDVAGDPYRLDNPFRVVLDLKKVAPGTVPAAPLGGPLKAGEQPGIHTIVIDPGHGGKEVGAIGPSGLMEKDTTLAICRKLADMLERKLGTRVILTRDTDEVVPLTQRTAIANQYKADLFVSVHLNASVMKNAHGAETYFLSLEASDELARKAAETENASQTTGAAKAGDGDLDLILWDLAQQEYLKESSRLAEVIQGQMNRAMAIENRGVKQAPFKVLVGATMPAALVEVGFISNPEEEAKLKDDKYESTIAQTLFDAISQYKNEYEVRIGAAQPAAPKPAAPAAPAQTTTAAAQPKSGR